MSSTAIRVGIVGAGENTRKMHIPGFHAIAGVSVTAVANRSRASGERAAAQFGIPRVFDTWEELVASDVCDAVCIGTWPYIHCPVTLAALQAGKHVLCEARMALNAREARRMLAAAQARPDRVAQVVPAPFTLPYDRTVQTLLKEGYLGDLLAVEVRHTQGAFLDPVAPLHWRMDAELSGLNILTMGIWYEMLMRWIGPARKVVARTRINVPNRADAAGTIRAVHVPDHVDILSDMACGAAASFRFSAVTGLGASAGISLFGSEGTLVHTMTPPALRGGRRGDKTLADIPVSPGPRDCWRVEEEFIGAIRGEEPVRLTTFEDGVRYMEFTEAVARSASTGRAIELPLTGD